ncbi:MAG: hypothetical protein V2A78_00985 [bacterium]
MKKFGMILFCIILGLIVGLLASEFVLRLIWGNPYKELVKNYVSYFEFEIYDPFFRKVKSPDGELLYIKQRSGVVGEASFPALKPTNTKRIFILGESVAADFGARSSELLKSRLQRYFPSCQFEIVPCRTGGYDSYRVCLIMKEILNYQPDLILLFVGNNSASHLRPGLPLKLYAKTWIYRLLDRNFMARSTVQRGENEINSVFSNDLEQMSEFARQKKVLLAIYTLPCNFKDLAPFGPGWFFDRGRFMAQIAFEKGQWDQAITILEKQLILGELRKNAQVYYAIGQCLEKKLEYSRAREYYLKALVLSGGLRWRCSARKNRIIRETAEINDLILVDLEKKFISIAPHGLLGDEFFMDNCHWLPPYDSVVIEELISSLQDYLKRHSNPSFGPGPQGPSRSNEALVAQKAFQEAGMLTRSEAFLTETCLWGISYILQKNEAGYCLYYLRKAAKYNPGVLIKMISSREDVRKRIMEIPWLVPIVNRLDASWPDVLWQAGEALRESGNYTLALNFFNRALKLNGERNNIEPYLLRGLTFFLMGDRKKALKDWEFVIEMNPGMMWLREIKSPGLKPAVLFR